MGNCPECGVCLCTGSLLMYAKDRRVCCSNCVNRTNKSIEAYLLENPNITLNYLIQKNKKK